MKSIRSFLAILIIVISFSCQNSMIDFSPSATGNAGEILVVIPDNLWNTEIGDTIKSVFHQYITNVPMEEYLFTLYNISKEEFIDLNKRNRNVLYPEISNDIKEADIRVNRNKYAKGQVIATIKAPNAEEFIKIFIENKDELLKLFYNADRDRWLDYYTKYQINSIREQIEKNQNVSITIPQGYSLDVNEKDFAWISFEMRKASYGIFVYSYPFNSKETFTKDYLIKKRNEILKKNVPGERKGSYMTTETRFDIPTFEIINHNNEYTASIKGMWKVHKDFMGGPFVSYTKADTMRNRVVTVEGFVYKPNKEIRIEIRKLEAILHTMKIMPMPEAIISAEN